MGNDEKDYVGEITQMVRNRDYLEGQWSIHTELVEKDGGWEASALDGKYTATGISPTHAMEQLHKQLYDEGMQGKY